MSGVLMLVLARARRRPARWALPGLGIALAIGFAGAVWAQGEVAGTQAARVALAAVPSADGAVRVTWTGPVTAAARTRAVAALHGLGLGSVTEVTLLDPVRLSGTIVRPAAIAPLAAWSRPGRSAPCRVTDCPVLGVGPGPGTGAVLATSGARLRVTGRAELRSAVPLGFVPEAAAGEYPLLLTGDLRGLDALPGLGGVYRTHSWVTPLSTARLARWDLPGLTAALHRAQAELQAASPQYTLTAPFAALAAARSAADAVPDRLALAGGGAAAALALFIVLSAGGLRADQERERSRLALAGARRAHQVAFVALEALWCSAVATLAGAALALAAAALLAHHAGVPVGGALDHSLLDLAGVAALFAGWVLAAALLTGAALAANRVAADGLALASATALVAALATGSGHSGSLALLLAPLACLAAGVLVFRAAGALAVAGERVARRGPVLVRLALVGLARAPAAPALAVAFIALSTGLGAFALLYRATLDRSASDQAAQLVPLTATVAASAAFTRPLSLAPQARWRAMAGGPVLAVRRTQASYVSGGSSVTVAALGVPAWGLASLRDWSTTGASVPAHALARRLVTPGPVRAPGPRLPAGARALSLAVASPQLDVDVTAALRASDGAVTTLDLGVAGPHTAVLDARLPPGRWEVEAFELSEPTGLEVTNGHQNGENPAAATQHTVPVAVGPLHALGGDGAVLGASALGSWGAAGPAHVLGGGGVAGAVRLAYAESGLVAVVRPVQPSDSAPVPVLADPATAAAAGRGGRIGLEVDGLPVNARVVGVLPRFYTVPSAGPGFIVADEATLASALEAQMPGQGASDELWLASPHPAALRAALAQGALSALTTTFAADVARALRDAPVAHAVTTTLTAATVLSAALAVLGLLVALRGALRDRATQDDLLAQGLGPRALRMELRLRLGAATAAGVLCGLIVAVILAHLAVAVVSAAGTTASPDPPLSAVSPLPLLAAWTVAAAAALAVTCALATARLPGAGR